MEPVSGPTWPILTVESLGAQPATATAIAAALVRSTFLATEAFTRVANMQISRGRKKGVPAGAARGKQALVYGFSSQHFRTNRKNT